MVYRGFRPRDSLEMHENFKKHQFYMFEFSSRFTSFFEPKPYKQEIGGQSYNGSKIVNYDSRGSPDKKIAHIMTLGS